MPFLSSRRNALTAALVLVLGAGSAAAQDHEQHAQNASDGQAAAHNALTAQEQANGWKLLFNGKNLDGWHSYGEKAPGANWSVHDGSIQLKRERSGNAVDFADLITHAQFANFDLKLDWKTTPCADSGVIFYVHESKEYSNTWETGSEMQIADLACTVPDSRVLYERSGDLFDLISSDVERVNATGEGNHFEIRADHGHLQFFQNGHPVIDTHLWDAEWKTRVAETKFSKMPGFGTFHQGHIALQGGENKGQTPITLWFRDIRIKQL